VVKATTKKKQGIEDNGDNTASRGNFERGEERKKKNKANGHQGEKLGRVWQKYVLGGGGKGVGGGRGIWCQFFSQGFIKKKDHGVRG